MVEFFGQKNEVSSESADNKIEASHGALPELVLTELLKSEKPIVENEEKTVKKILPWNNYTLVLYNDLDEIKIFDEEARNIENFDESKNSLKVRIDWNSPKIRLITKNKSYIAANGTNYNSVSNCFIRELPKGLAKQAQKIIDEQGRDYFKLNEQESIHITTLSNICAYSEKYIVLYNEEGDCSVLVTKNEKDITLAPKDWERLDSRIEGVPDEIEDFIKRILKERNDFKKINDTYSVVTTDVGISILRTKDDQEELVFSQLIPSAGDNIAVDPINQDVVYFCQNVNARSINRLDLKGDPHTWKNISVEFPKRYENISNLQLDPTGNFFLFYTKEGLVMLTKDTLEEVHSIPGLSNVNFDNGGNIRGIDKDGFLVIYEPHFNDLIKEMEKRRAEKLVENIKIVNVFDFEDSKKEKEEKGEEGYGYLEKIRDEYAKQFDDMLAKVDTTEGVRQVRKGFDKLTQDLKQQDLKSLEINYIVSGLNLAIREKEKECSVKSAKETLDMIKTKLAAGLSLASVSEARAEMDKLKGIDNLLDDALREETRKVALELEQGSLELFQQRGSEIIKDLHGIIERTKLELQGYVSKSQMDDWLEFRYPQLKSRLGSLAMDVPIEADEAYKAIVTARTDLQAIAQEYEMKFKQEYAKVREKAVKRIEAMIDVINQDIDGLIARLRSKGFTDRNIAEEYLNSSEAYQALKTEIEALSNDNPDESKEMEKKLKVNVSNALTEIERGALTKVAETGQQMVLFGKTAFPKWEAKVKEKVQRIVDLTFEEDARTHGPGVKATDILGDVALSIRNSNGKMEKVRLYEGWEDENEWRLGLLSYRGKEIAPSYVTAEEFKGIRKDYSDWSLGEKSKLRSELREKRKALEDLYEKRQKIGKETGGTRTPKEDNKWKAEYQQKLNEYAEFAVRHNIPLLHRIDKIKADPEIEYTNGKGFIPEWQSHWVVDPQTEDNLEEMAVDLKMQMDLQEGLLNLKGHAGTGKDVLVKMFCSLTNRPYFGTDGTKWTTEFELSEDVMLESKDGASQTVKIPSTVLNGITTPGAIVYFNEFNAMPEQAQIFLHALMDEKRSLTLKTSSGKTIRALPSVLLVGSMNPGYPGTFDPQFATKSRMVSLEVNYPPLTRQPGKGDSNSNPPYDASEALRIARGVDSLADLTYEASLDHNEFVKIWDNYVNGIDNGAQELKVMTQKFDIDVTLALVQFSSKLREDFIKIFEKSREVRNSLPVSQPVTGRELRRCAYALSKMTAEEKVNANPENIARELLEKYFLSHIDKKEDQLKILEAMNTWTSQKRVRA